MDLIVRMDDATDTISSGVLVPEEGTASTFHALLEVLGQHGLPLSLYTDHNNTRSWNKEQEGEADSAPASRQPGRSRWAFLNLRKDAAPGIDGLIWAEYAENLEGNLAGLHERVHRGAYRALPSRRRFIPKPDGRQRPLGIAAQEDKIVQVAVVAILTPIYEAEFLAFSYGFRPGEASMMRWTRSGMGLKDAISGGSWTPTSGRSSIRSATSG
jgi:hypothetical protein